MKLKLFSLVFGEEFMHVFDKADDNDKSGADSANYKHRNQNVIDPFKKKLHSKSVLRTAIDSGKLQI